MKNETTRRTTNRSAAKRSPNKKPAPENGKYKFAPRPDETFDEFYVRMQAIVYDSYKRAREAESEDK